MERDIGRVLIGQRELGEICDRLATRIGDDYAGNGRDLVIVSVLKGSFVFAADLIRRIPLPVDVEFMKVSSYGTGTCTSGTIRVHLDLKRDIRDADVIVVEDILDSGKTMQQIFELLSGREPHSLRCCVLLDKPERREVPFEPDYVGKQIPDEFVVGYGLDYGERYRNLPYVGVLKPEIYQ